MGTPGYVAPEVLEGAEGNAAGDLYSLGVMLYQMLTGVNPFRGATRLEVAAPAGERLRVAVYDLAGRRVRATDLSLRPLARFVRAYALKQGFRDGFPGFAIASITAFHVFLKYARLWELERRRGA